MNVNYTLLLFIWFAHVFAFLMAKNYKRAYYFTTLHELHPCFIIRKSGISMMATPCSALEDDFGWFQSCFRSAFLPFHYFITENGNIRIAFSFSFLETSISCPYIFAPMVRAWDTQILMLISSHNRKRGHQSQVSMFPDRFARFPVLMSQRTWSLCVRQTVDSLHQNNIALMTKLKALRLSILVAH